MDELAKAQGRWRRKLNGEAFPVIERWLKRAARYVHFLACRFDAGVHVVWLVRRCFRR